MTATTQGKRVQIYWKHDLGGVVGESIRSAQSRRRPVGAGLPAL